MVLKRHSKSITTLHVRPDGSTVATAPLSVAVITTCHNRRQKTSAWLQSVQRQVRPGLYLRFYVTDDGSSDGTRESIRELSPEAIITQGNGSLFWAGGMAASFARALSEKFDFFLLMNDDVELAQNAIERLLATYYVGLSTGQEPIVIGSMIDPLTGSTSYGGFVTSRWNRLKLRRVEPHPHNALSADTMNGNCVLIPAKVAATLGNLDRVFRHSMADIDYGLRASRAGIPIYVAPGHIGRCELNESSLKDGIEFLGLRAFFRKLCSPKGLPPDAWLRLTCRHAGMCWPLFFVWPYCRIAACYAARKLFRFTFGAEWGSRCWSTGNSDLRRR